MLQDVMREVARAHGMSDRSFDVNLATYIEAGTLTAAERNLLLSLSHYERVAWLREQMIAGRFTADAAPMIGIDFEAHGFILPEGLAKW
jgi:hypothetical protein